ncbi:AAA family ATPase [candidate division KSB1 bacterium]
MKITIASGKGGTGKTTLSTNLTAFIGEDEKVLLCDLDVEEPNSGLFIKGELVKEETKYKMIPEWKKDHCTFCGHCQEYCNFHAVIRIGNQIMIFPEMCHSCYACSELCPTTSLSMMPKRMGTLKYYRNGNISFIESRLDIGQEQAVPLIKQTKDFIDQLSGNYKIILYDAPPGTSCPVIEATKDADFVILITEPTPFGLHDLSLSVETMKLLKKEFAVVINRFGIGNDDVLTYCKKNQIPILAKIPNDRMIASLYSKGALCYENNPECRRQLKKIWEYIKELNNL